MTERCDQKAPESELRTHAQRFGRLRGRPERPGVNAVRMQRKHLLVQLYRRRCTPKRCDEVTEIPSRFFDVARRAIGIEHTVPCNHGFRSQGFDCVEGAEPLVASLFVALGKIEMRVVVDAVSRYD